MEDLEYRIIFNVDRGDVLGAAMFFFGPDGQQEMVGAVEFSPFSTRSEMVSTVLKWCVDHARLVVSASRR